MSANPTRGIVAFKTMGKRNTVFAYFCMCVCVCTSPTWFGHDLWNPVAQQVSMWLLPVWIGHWAQLLFFLASFLCNSWKTFHGSFFFAARCVFKSSSAHVTLSRIALNLLICWVVSCYEVRLPIRVNIIPCGCVTKLEVCFCGFARCFCGFHTVDMKSSHLRGTGCLAHVSVARHTGSLDFLLSAGALLHLWPCSLAFHHGEFLMLLFLFDLVLFMSSPVGGMGYLSPQRSISPCDV